MFIDDTEENVTAARDQGFAGVVYMSYDDLMVELKKRGVETG